MGRREYRSASIGSINRSIKRFNRGEAARRGFRETRRERERGRVERATFDDQSLSGPDPYPKMPRVTTAGFSSVSSHFSDTVAVTSWSFLLRSSVWEAARTVKDAARALGAASKGGTGMSIGGRDVNQRDVNRRLGSARNRSTRRSWRIASSSHRRSIG